MEEQTTQQPQEEAPVPAENKANEAKENVKKGWNAFVRFIKPFTNLKDTQLVSASLEPFAKKHVDMIYLVCMIISLISLVLSVLTLNLLGLVSSLLFFILCRFLCEILTKSNKE